MFARFIFLFLTFFATSAMAAQTLYRCTFAYEARTGGGWIPEELLVLHDTATGTVQVNDPIIQHFVGTPVVGRLVDETKVRSTFAWEVDTVDPRNQSTRMLYRLSYYRDGKRASISAQPGGFDNNYSGKGTCTVTQG